MTVQDKNAHFAVLLHLSEALNKKQHTDLSFFYSDLSKTPRPVCFCSAVSINSASSHLTPLLHTALLRRVSMRTSGVPISFTANLRISLMARGALFLKPLQGDNTVNHII